MARPIWQGSISFGLAHIPVELYSAVKRAGVLSFKLLDKRDHAKIRYERVNEVSGKPIPWENIAKGYEVEKNRYVILSDQEFKKAHLENSKTVSIEDFVDLSSIPPIYFEKPYYLMPQKQGEKGYVLLRETLKRTKKVGIAKVVIRTKEYLAVLMPFEEALVLNILRFASEVLLPADFKLPKARQKLSPKELAIAEQLVASMQAKWNPKKYHDDYHEKLLRWIKAKAKGGKKVKAPTLDKEDDIPHGEVIDFMSLLKKSIKSKKTTSRRRKKPTHKKRATR